MAASCMLEWTRLYRLEPLLPGDAGGVVGHVMGPLAMRWLGFTGSGLLGIVLVVLGAAWVLRFSWGPLGRAGRAHRRLAAVAARPTRGGD